jgi:hypothetical protein
MISCCEVIDRLGDPEPRRRSLRERLAVRLHLLRCRDCRQHARHLRTLERLSREYGERIAKSLSASADTIAAKAREEIRASLLE